MESDKKKIKEITERVLTSNTTSDLLVQDIENHLPTVGKQYRGMVKNINSKMPAINKSLENFYKSKSQLSYATIDVTYLTPERQMYGILVEIETTKNAIEENMMNMKKKEILIEKRRKKLLETNDDTEKKLLEANIMHMEIGNKNSMKYLRGAIRKLNYFTNLYEHFLEKIGKKEITEEDYEKGEIKHHIFTAMKQALHAARASGGRIDEGNYIYLFDIGINGATAQVLLTEYLMQEEELIKEGRYPTQEMTLQFLEKCYKVFKDDVVLGVEKKNFIVLDKESLAMRNKNGKKNS